MPSIRLSNKYFKSIYLNIDLKVAKKTDAHMRKFSNVKNQSLLSSSCAFQLYAQNAPDRVGCQS